MRESDTANLNVPSAEAMRELGRDLGRALARHRGNAVVVAIQGELGAGKTTFVGGVLNALGIAGPARSPTYTLVEPYDVADRQVFHLDLYRLADPREVDALGVRDLLSVDSVLLIEWPERGEGMIPPADLDLSIGYCGDDQREITLHARGAVGRELLRQLPVVR
ncbi:tRNA (adenosine(37)-N6)-threonylcarbamoyltransferase complex ATPase subunit type 1 TsaE [Povalibacter sp.]|uniref:tRNA (adenosine(37)-N6)-threonylcarbamoyltransferase complex ATPase subunit type 1 TsaE n=1 Tax=Povalibacter sp. TaxID=1962978 RepID=UPI002F3F1D99